MTTTTYDFEGGSNGVNLGTGGGITAVSGSPPTYSTAAATHSSALGVSSVGTQWAEWDGPDNDWSMSIYLKCTVSPGTGSQRPILFRTAAGALAGAFRFHSSGVFAIANASNVAVGANSTTTWDTDDVFRFDIQIDTIAPDMEISVRIFKNANVDGTTPDETLVRTLSTVDVDRVRIGGFDSGSWTMLWDNLRISDLLEWLGPYDPPAAPLDTPVVTVTDESPPSTPGGSDGSITFTWPAVSGADHYASAIAGGHGVTSGFTIIDSSANSPQTFINLPAGQYTVAVRAVP